MEHYIKINKYAFDTNNPKKVMVEVYFDLEEGSDTTNNNQGYYTNLTFKSVHVDTQKTFICANDWSSLATSIDYTNSSAVTDEQYSYLDGSSVITSSRRKLNIVIDLDDINLNGVLSTETTFEDKLLFFFVTVEGNYNAHAQSYIAQQPKTLMFSLYDPRRLYNLIYNNLLGSMDLDCCTCLDCNSVNNIVFLHGLESALQIGKWQDAVKYWKLLHADHNMIRAKSCNCR